MWRRTQNHWGYSPLDQINKDNVGTLRLAWAWTMAPGLQETTPLVHDGVMFLPQACDFIEAVDATNGNLLWEYRRPEVDHVAPLSCANRNGTLYGDRLYLATRDAFLVALDVRTGEVIWERRMGDWTVGQHYSGGPQILDGKLVAGMSGCYYINTFCWVSAHDPEPVKNCGAPIPFPASASPTVKPGAMSPTSGAAAAPAWMPASYDPDLDLIYIGVGVPIPWGDIQRQTDGGDVLYTNSTLALHADSGDIAWHFQHIPGGNWDLDHPFERLVVESEIAPDANSVSWLNPNIDSNASRKVITGVPGKTGIIWTLDAATGEFLWARETNYQNVIIGVDIENHKGITDPNLYYTEIRQRKTNLSHNPWRHQLAGCRIQPADQCRVYPNQQRLYGPVSEPGGTNRWPAPPLGHLADYRHTWLGRTGRSAICSGCRHWSSKMGPSPTSGHWRLSTHHRWRPGIRFRRCATFSCLRCRYR